MNFKQGGYNKFRELALAYGLTEDQIYSIALGFECGLEKASAMQLCSILRKNGKIREEKATKIMEVLSQDED